MISKDKRRRTIGRCYNFSIPVAALIFFYEMMPEGRDYVDYGELDWMHDIVGIAGGRQCGMCTSRQVSISLSQSPYWDSRYCPGYYGGYGNGGANIYTPSEKGLKKYKSLKRTELLTRKEY